MELNILKTRNRRRPQFVMRMSPTEFLRAAMNQEMSKKCCEFQDISKD